MFVLVAYSLFVQNSNSTYSVVLCHAVSSVCCGPAETINPFEPLLQPLLPMLLWPQVLLPSLVLNLVLSLIVKLLHGVKTNEAPQNTLAKALSTSSWVRRLFTPCASTASTATRLHSPETFATTTNTFQQGSATLLQARPLIED